MEERASPESTAFYGKRLEPCFVRLVDEMPRSALNKIAKAQLRQSLVDKACQAPALTPDPRTEREP